MPSLRRPYYLIFFSCSVSLTSPESWQNCCAVGISLLKTKLRATCFSCLWGSFGSRLRVTLKTEFEECRQWKVLTCVCMCMYVWYSMYGCLPPFLLCAQNLWQPVTVAFMFLIPNLYFFFFLSVFRMTKRKLLQLRLQVVFLTWSFLSRIVINIYTFIFQCNKDAIMYCVCTLCLYVTLCKMCMLV